MRNYNEKQQTCGFYQYYMFIFFCSKYLCFCNRYRYRRYTVIDQQIAEDVEKYHIPGMAVAVVDKDNILFEKTYGDCENIDQPFIIGSMSKSFTALAVMQLSELHKINLDSSIDEYIDTSEWFVKNTDHSRITVKDLLNHTRGITTYQTLGTLKSTDSYGSFVIQTQIMGCSDLL